MEVAALVASIFLVVSLALPRWWLHAVGVANCAVLLVRAVQIGEVSFIVMQVCCLAMNAVGVVTLWRAKPEKHYSEERDEWWK